MSCDEVPRKFTEWLLSMGCPSDKVPSQDKIAEMCRGQYHMVWRSLMEHVDARDAVRQKRMQVFCDDVRRCQKNNVFSQHDTSTLVPEQLSLWKQQHDLKKQVKEAKASVTLARRDLDHLMDRVSNKISQRALARTRVDNLSRRVWLLRQVAGELAAKKTTVEETRVIADSLCSTDEDTDTESKLDKCLSAFRRQNSPGHVSLSTSNSSVTSAGEDDFEELALQLVKSRGDVLCAALCQRRSALVHDLTKGGDLNKTKQNKVTPQSVLAHSAALHCTLMLEATKNKVHLKHARRKLLAAVTELNNYLSGESCELLVLRCEKTHTSARVGALRALLDDLNNNGGVFHTPRTANVYPTQANPTHTIDKAIESKRESLKRVMVSLSSTERKVHGAREWLQLVFAAFRPRPHPHPRAHDAHTHAHTHTHSQLQQYKGMQLDLPSESIPSLREYYSRRRARARRPSLSMELEMSDGSLADLIDYNNPRFVDEIRIYLKKFSLEKNRQLVLESGEKLWIFETIQASVHRLHAAWAAADVSSSLLCLSRALPGCVSRIANSVRDRDELQAIVRGLQAPAQIPNIDITAQREEEEQITDRTKKRLRENLLELQKTNKVFVQAEENLKFWSDNIVKKYISQQRKHDGMTYRDYEVYFMENCLNACPRYI